MSSLKKLGCLVNKLIKNTELFFKGKKEKEELVSLKLLKRSNH